MAPPSEPPASHPPSGIPAQGDGFAFAFFSQIQPKSWVSCLEWLTAKCLPSLGSVWVSPCPKRVGEGLVGSNGSPEEVSLLISLFLKGLIIENFEHRPHRGYTMKTHMLVSTVLVADLVPSLLLHRHGINWSPRPQQEKNKSANPPALRMSKMRLLEQVGEAANPP